MGGKGGGGESKFDGLEREEEEEEEEGEGGTEVFLGPRANAGRQTGCCKPCCVAVCAFYRIYPFIKSTCIYIYI